MTVFGFLMEKAIMELFFIVLLQGELFCEFKNAYRREIAMAGRTERPHSEYYA